MDANIHLHQDLARLRHAELIREATQHRLVRPEPEPKREPPRRSRTIARLLARVSMA